MSSRPIAQLPALYQPWVEALVGASIPAERGATCDRCAMLPDEGSSGRAGTTALPRQGQYFDPRVKCCTYTPTLPNFLVGRVLLDDDPAMRPGRDSVGARIAAGVGVTPTGLLMPRPFGLLYDKGGTEIFGRSVAMRCPHYLTASGGCGIWRHRNSVCGTWFCKYERGAVGEAFWTALMHLLRAIERALAAHCVHRLDPGPEAVQHLVAQASPEPNRPLTADEVDGLADATRHRAIWGRYAGREREFFTESARLVEGLGWREVRRLGGAPVDLAAAAVTHAYRALMSHEIPARLRTRSIAVEPAGTDQVVVSAYRPYDPLTVPAALVHVLHFFDGRTTREALEATAAAGVAIDRRAVRRLVDFDVLADATEDGAEHSTVPD